MTETFYHALQIDKKSCIGCSHCMSVCPTEALRVLGGKAHLIESRCIDCGECYKVCPVKAIEVKQDDFNKIFNYKYRVALFPAILLGQFPKEVKIRKIYSALYNIGFTHVFEVEHTTNVILEKSQEYLSKQDIERPVISSFCPAVVRLIQVKFPSLLDNILPFKTPHDLAALFYKDKFASRGIEESEVGIFYITPCAAKIAAVKSPVGEVESVVDGVINLDFIFNKISQNLNSVSDSKEKPELNKQLSEEGIMWSLTGGESANMQGRCLSVDGIQNVIQFLNRVESGEITNVDFLELRSCDEGCAGGILCPENRFLAVEKMKKISAKFSKLEAEHKDIYSTRDMDKHKQYLLDNMTVDNIPARNMDKLADDMATSLKMLQKIHDIQEVLPQINCGVCGAPSCNALAEDIVRNEDSILKCFFVQKYLNEKKLLDSKKSNDILARIWSKKKILKVENILNIIENLTELEKK